MPTDSDSLARRAWASAHARHEAAQAIQRLANSPHVRGYEKQEFLVHLKLNPGYATEIHAALWELVQARAAQPDPHAGLHAWGRRQHFSRAYSRQQAGVSEPSHFNTRKEFTTR